MRLIITICTILITICQVSKAVDIFVTDTGGYNIFLGNFGYHITMGTE